MTPQQSLHAVTILVPSYDAGLTFFVDTLGFTLCENLDLGTKRWVRVQPDGGGTSLILAEPTTAAQKASLGSQTGDRVGFFLKTGQFDTDFARMTEAGIRFEEEPRQEPYGKVAVWRDPFGNRWDLIEFS